MTFPRMNCPRLSTYAALTAALIAVPALADDHMVPTDLTDDASNEALLVQEQLVDSEGDVSGVNVSGVVGVDLYSHFVSYGLDVWAEGNAFSGSETFNPYIEVGLDLGSFSVATGLWGDINDNAVSGLGGDIQEVDWYVGVSTDVDKFSVGVTYQAWMYGGGTEEILDVSLGYDDSEFWGDDDFSISPSLTIHNRIASSLGQEEGTVVVAGAEFAVDALEDAGVSLGVPVAVAAVLDEDYFIAGGDDGFAFFSVGLSAGYSLGEVIGAEYGDWSLNAGVTYYATEDGVYNNPEDDFLVYNVGVSMAF